LFGASGDVETPIPIEIGGVQDLSPAGLERRWEAPLYLT
jgi:hypothetical protein